MFGVEVAGDIEVGGFDGVVQGGRPLLRLLVSDFEQRLLLRLYQILFDGVAQLVEVALGAAEKALKRDGFRRRQRG